MGGVGGKGVVKKGRDQPKTKMKCEVISFYIQHFSTRVPLLSHGLPLLSFEFEEETSLIESRVNPLLCSSSGPLMRFSSSIKSIFKVLEIQLFF